MEEEHSRQTGPSPEAAAFQIFTQTTKNGEHIIISLSL